MMLAQPAFIVLTLSKPAAVQQTHPSGIAILQETVNSLWHLESDWRVWLYSLPAVSNKGHKDNKSPET